MMIIIKCPLTIFLTISCIILIVLGNIFIDGSWISYTICGLGGSHVGAIILAYDIEKKNIKSPY